MTTTQPTVQMSERAKTGLRMRAMLRRDSPLFTRPMNSSMSFGLFPAAVMRVGVGMSFSMGRS